MFNRNNAGDRLVSARRWLDIIVANRDDDGKGADEALIDYVKGYIRFLEDGTGIKAGYESLFERRCELVATVRKLTAVYDYIANMAERPDDLPADASRLLRFLSASSLEMAASINNFERGNPDLASQFVTERTDYQRVHEYWVELDRAEAIA